MKSPTPEAKCAKDVFQIQYPNCRVNFSNNNESKNLLDSTFETSLKLTSTLA